MILLFDTHTHDYFSSFDEDRSEMIERGKNNGVKKKVQIGCDEVSSIMALDLAKKHEGFYATVGLHPCDVSNIGKKIEHRGINTPKPKIQNVEELFEFFKILAQENKKKVVGIGETGLDFFHNDDIEHISAQYDAFERSILLSHELELPLIIHTREAGKQTLEFLKERKHLLQKGVIHCFCEDSALAKVATQELGFFLGIGGTATYKRNEYIREAIEVTPLEYLVTETDAPFLAPQSHRGKRNESIYLSEVVELIANLKKMRTEECAHILFENGKQLFDVQ